MNQLIKRKMDWEGLRVESLTSLRNGWGEIPSGTHFMVTDWTRGLSLKSVPCDCCGVQVYIGRVDAEDVHILDIPYNHERIRWNAGRKYVKGVHGRYLTEPSDPKPEHQSTENGN